MRPGDCLADGGHHPFSGYCLRCGVAVSSLPMRIAFAGASGTGKSTLARAVAEEFGLELNPVGARTVAAAMGFASPYDVDAAGRRVEFQRRLFEEKRAWEAARERFCTDRTPLDNLAYLALHGGARSVSEEEFRAYGLATERYDLVFLCGADDFQAVGDDPSRVTDPGSAYHRVYEALLTGLLNRPRFVRRRFSVPGLSLADRRAFVLHLAREILGPAR